MHAKASLVLSEMQEINQAKTVKEGKDEMTFKQWVSKHTRPVRQFVMLKIAGVVTPRLLKRMDPNWLPRPMIRFASEHFRGRPVVGAEIGVFYGFNAKSILQTLNITKLYLIDPYIPFVSENVINKPTRSLPMAIKKLSHFKNRIRWVRKLSEDAIHTFPDDFFDFVYVDGNHDYAFVKKDLKGYWQKVRKGGILGGHDFCGDFAGVVKAVVEFSKWMNVPFLSRGHDYWFIKDY